MPRMCPFRFIVFDEAGCALPERHRSGAFSRSRPLLCALVGDWINIIEPQLARVCGALSGLSKRERMARADAHIAQAAVGDIAENPLLRSAVGNAQIQTAAVSIHPGLLFLLNLER